MPTYIATRFTCKIHTRPLEVLWRPPPLRRYPRRDARQPLRVVEQTLIHIRSNVSRRDSIHGDALCRPAIGQRLCQLSHSPLGRRIRGHVEPALEGQQRGKVDDGPAPPRHRRRLEREHVGADVAAQGEDAVDVDLHDLVEVAVGKRLAGVPPLDAGAVDEDADGVAVGEDRGGEAGDLGLGGKVGGVDGGLAAEGFYGGFRVG